jgi:hypothetical protein
MPAAATASAEWMAELPTISGNPVTAVPGKTPRFPRIREEPVLVTAAPARTANPDAFPRETAADGAHASAAAGLLDPSSASSTSSRAPVRGTRLRERAGGRMVSGSNWR